MKQIYLLVFLFIGAFVNAQVEAPDFTVTDLDGNEYNLYTVLEEGKVVVLDASATWCPPCWSFHNGEFLKNIHDKYGPDGTNEVLVLFYEGDASTDDDALAGISGNTQGDWLTGAPYPFINESPITLNSSVWWPLGFPTISVVRPDDKMIIADLYDPWVAGDGLAGMEDIIEGAFPTSSSVENLTALEVSVYPNPFVDEVKVDLTSATINASSIQLLDISGSVLQTVQVDRKSVITINTIDLLSGVYLLNVYEGQEIVGTIKLTK
jgi:thiol-disulfide isomerase/thioredoxin